MRAEGVKVEEYGTHYDTLDINDRWHEKHLIVDNQLRLRRHEDRQ